MKNCGGPGITKYFSIQQGELYGHKIIVCDSPGPGDGENYLIDSI